MALLIPTGDVAVGQGSRCSIVMQSKLPRLKNEKLKKKEKKKIRLEPRLG